MPVMWNLLVAFYEQRRQRAHGDEAVRSFTHAPVHTHHLDRAAREAQLKTQAHPSPNGIARHVMNPLFLPDASAFL